MTGTAAAALPVFKTREGERRSRMPSLRGEIVPGAHHLAALARPDVVNRRILEFLRAAPQA